MKLLRDGNRESGWILLCALGVPVPILVLLFLNARLHITK